MSEHVDISLKVEGLEKVMQAFNSLSKNMAGKAMRKALRDGAKVVADEARNLCPVDTGRLRDSIRVRAGRRKKDYIRMVVISGKGDRLFSGETYYGSFVELGSVHNKPPEPFMRSAMHHSEKTSEAAIIATLRNELGIK